MTEKIGFIGAGRVGSTAAYATLHTVDCDEIAIVDIMEDLAVGEAMDLETSAIVLDRNVLVRGGSDYLLLKNSNVIVITAGLARKPGMSRLDLTKKNVGIITEIAKKATKVAPKAVLVVVTNPVDVMTYAVYKASGKPRREVLGMGALHDTVRLVGAIKELGGKNVETMIIGEHGDSMFPLKSRTRFTGVAALDWDAVIRSVRERGMAIIERKGATTYTPAACAVRMVKAIINDEHVEIPVSAVLEGEYGLRGLAMGVPAIIGKGGLLKIVEYDLTDEEKTNLRESGNILKNITEQVGLA